MTQAGQRKSLNKALYFNETTIYTKPLRGRLEQIVMFFTRYIFMENIQWIEYDENTPDESDLCVALTPLATKKKDHINLCKFTNGSFIDLSGNTLEPCVTHFIVISNAKILIDNIVFQDACSRDNQPTIID